MWKRKLWRNSEKDTVRQICSGAGRRRHKLDQALARDEPGEVPARQAPFRILAAQGKSATFGIWDKVTVLDTVSQTITLRSPDQSRHPQTGILTSWQILQPRHPIRVPCPWLTCDGLLHIGSRLSISDGRITTKEIRDDHTDCYFPV